MLVSRRDDLEGMDDKFMDDTVKGLNAWTSAADRGLLRWGYMVFQKSVGKRNGLPRAPLYLEGARVLPARDSLVLAGIPRRIERIHPKYA